MKYNDLPERCKSCQNLKTWGSIWVAIILFHAKKEVGDFTQSANVMTKQKRSKKHVDADT